MSKLKNTTVQADYTSSDFVKYVGPIPTCALTGDCTIDETSLTYLLGIVNNLTLLMLTYPVWILLV